jgi:hypothetical protein
MIDRERARESGTVQQQIDAEETRLKLLMALSQLRISVANADSEVAAAKAAVEVAEAGKPPPPRSTSVPTTRSAEAEARLQSARQALTIARDECLGRFRQTTDFAEVSERLRLSQIDRERARQSGNVLKQMQAEQAHKKLLTTLCDLMVNAFNVDAHVREASTALRAAEAAAMANEAGDSDRTAESKVGNLK